MKYTRIIFAAVLGLAAFSACKTQYDQLLEGNDVDAKYKAAFEYFNQGKYNKSAALFESMAIATAGTERDDTVQYYWGLSNYNNKDYFTAESNFTRFLSSYPRSPFSENADFLRLDCMYRSTLRYELDQTPTYKAMTAIGEYLIAHPTGANSDVCRHMLEELGARLDKKALENAKLYYKMEDYLASRVAFRNILKDDADNIYREDILYYTAMSSYKYALNSIAQKQKERYLVFIDDYFNFVGEYPDSHYRKELDGLYAKVKEKN
ncbi:MAG: outer membrane protein assembly factor BamD [Bacteroidales bacterium]|nr:outer membrane protein assembly factor BamD [Candidatus Cryptobacteroides equifaecalis]